MRNARMKKVRGAKQKQIIKILQEKQALDAKQYD